MKKVYILLSCVLLLPKLVRAQYYIELNKENTFHYGNSYLIDVPIKNARGNLLVRDFVGIIPLIAYSKLLHEIDELTWQNKYDLNSISIIQPIKNDAPEYIIKYYPKGKIDTLKNIDEKLIHYKPLLNWTTWQNKAKLDSVLIYYAETYGSVCCPADPKWEMKVKLSDFISAFEKMHQVKIEKLLFSLSHGKEGEHTEYLTLSGLTPEQKIEFIDERVKLVTTNHEDLSQPVIYTPYSVAINSLEPRLDR